MQTEEWMKRKENWIDKGKRVREEDQRVQDAHTVFTNQVLENQKELENRNDDLSGDNQHNPSDLSFENSLYNDIVKAQVQFNTRLILKLEKRIKELEKKVTGESNSSW
tara:strand:- start:411 stop:734 length:324 start_codon:yes stop_codon:yes gene_type:complete